MPAIEIRGLAKSFGAQPALRDVSLDVSPGELFGLIGPDGAGKTTLLRIVCTLVQPDQGQVQVLGLDAGQRIAEVRTKLGYMPQRFSLYQDLSVEQNLSFFADLFRVPLDERPARLEQLFRFSRLAPFRERKAGALSGGMKQKLALMCALVHRPQVLVLDEPTMGVDPVSRQELWAILHEIRQQGAALLVSTAYMEEAGLCDRVALLSQGRILALGPPAELRARYPFRLFRVSGPDARALRSFLNRRPGVRSTHLFGDAVHVAFQNEPLPADWRSWQQQSQGILQDWQTQAPSIEDLFMAAATDPVLDPE